MNCHGHLTDKRKDMFFDMVIKNITFVVCILLVANLLLFINANTPPACTHRKATVQTPYYFVDEKQYWSYISDFAVCGDYLYVMYDGKSVLTCYDANGRYLHSYSFDMSKNGRSTLYVKDGKVYLESKGHNFYSFVDGSFTRYFSGQSPEGEELEKQLLSENASVSNADRYIQRRASIWRVNGSEETAIIERPLWLVIFQGPTQILCSLACILALILLNLFYWTKQRF